MTGAGTANGVRIEQAGCPQSTDADLDAIVAIEQASFDRPWSRASFEREFDVEHSKLLVARSIGSGDVVGYVCRRRVEDELQVLNLAVSPDFRRHGVGGLLLDAVVAEAAASDLSVVLEVEASNAPAVALYLARGFHPIGRRKHFYGRSRDGLILAWVPRASGQS